MHLFTKIFSALIIFRILKILLVIVVIGFGYEFANRYVPGIDLPLSNEITSAKNFILNKAKELANGDYKLPEDTKIPDIQQLEDVQKAQKNVQ